MATLQKTIQEEIRRALAEHPALVMYPEDLVDVLTAAVMQVVGRPKVRPARAEVDYFPLAKALAEVCVMDFDANRAELFREAKLLRKHPADVRKYYARGAWWYKDTWIGQQGRPPTPVQVRRTWGQWTQPEAKRMPEARARGGWPGAQ